MRLSAAETKEIRGKTDEVAMWTAQLEAARSISNPELRAREEAYVVEKLKKVEKALKERAKEEEELRAADAQRRKEDLRVRGFQTSGVYSYELPFRNEQESSSELALEQMLRDAGDSTGENWVRTDVGWSRKVNPVMESKSAVSQHEMSTQAYEALELRFGLRRSRSWDFLLALHCLTLLLRQYGVSSGGSLQKLMFRDIGVAMKTFLRFPQAASAVQELLKEGVAVHAEVAVNCQKQSISSAVAEERKVQCQFWLDQVQHHVTQRSGARAAAAAARTHAAQDDLVEASDWGVLPHELLLKIFSEFNNVRDLVRCSVVCSHWYDVANDDSLYRRLVTLLPASDVESRFSKVRSYKTVFIQLFSQLSSPVTGMYLCARCGWVFWAGKNLHCQAGKHEFGMVITPANLLEVIPTAWQKIKK